ncbi:hypothetical protein E4P43_17465, partial [Blastococcus sp. TF02A-35]
MSSPRDPDDRDGFDDGADGIGWREPSHLGPDGSAGGPDEEDRPNFADRRRRPRDESESLGGASWQPPGWDLPAAEPDRPAPPPADAPPPQ